jgi:hypothetical protein
MSGKAHNTVTITEGHIDYVAEYAVDNGMITVTVAHGFKTTQLGDTPPEELAKMLLREFIKEGKASDCV